MIVKHQRILTWNATLSQRRSALLKPDESIPVPWLQAVESTGKCISKLWHGMHLESFNPPSSSPTVKTKRSESSEVSLWNAIHSALALGPQREPFSSKKTQSSPLCCYCLSNFWGGAIPIDCSRLTLFNGRLLELSWRKWENAICKRLMTRRWLKFLPPLSRPFWWGAPSFSQREGETRWMFKAEYWSWRSWTAFIPLLSHPFRPLKRAAELLLPPGGFGPVRCRSRKQETTCLRASQGHSVVKLFVYLFPSW